MAPCRPLSPRSIVPSHAQIALAIAIIRSKPSGIPIREYILKMRAQLRLGHDPSLGQEASRYLDLVAYWQEGYRQMQQERDQLRSTNIKLERSNHQLASQANTATDSDPKSRSSKRKPASKPTSRPPKRAKPISTNDSEEQAIVDAQDTIENDSAFLDTLGVDGAKLTEALFTTHSLCRASMVDTSLLSLNVIQTISALGRVIRVVAENYEELSRGRLKSLETKALHSDKSDFAIALSVCARAFMSILLASHKLVEGRGGAPINGQIISELAEMFKSALTSIELSAKWTARINSKQPVPPKSRKGKRSVELLKDSVPACAISHLLNSFLGFLDKTDTFHQKIFDAFLFILFERVGRRLYYCTFGRHRAGLIQDSILPQAQAQDENLPTERNKEAVAIKLEVRALVLILERAMGLAPNHMNPQSSRANKDSNHLSRTLSFKNLPTASKARLSPLAKDRLQRTLITCMNGDSEKANDEFLDILIKPLPATRATASQSLVKVKEEDVERWYMEEVWKLVGWDILSRESSW